MRRAFTLVELLVVLGLIAVLLSLSLPAMAKARESARLCRCMAQMRTLGQFTGMYADMWKDVMPRSQHSAFAAQNPPWGRVFYEYVTDRAYAGSDEGWLAVFNGAYRCPSDRRRERWSYGYNVYFELSGAETDGRTWRRMSQSPSPWATALFAELSNVTTADHAMAHFWSQYGAPHEVDALRHKPGSDVVYLDGHARVARMTELFDQAAGTDAFNPQTAR